MSNYKTHHNIGALTGAITALAKLKTNSYHNFTWTEMISHTITGAIGGAIGGILPDIVEPAIHPHHRSIAHSYFAATFVTYQLRKEFQNYQANNSLFEVFLIAVKTGYLSHLGFDWTTPKSLPFLL